MMKAPAILSDTDRQLLRHTVATLAYRGGKALSGAPVTFAEFRASPTSRTPVQILAHIGDLLDWALSISQGRETWHNSPPLAWDKQIERFFGTLQQFDNFLASPTQLQAPPDKLFQGPIADALTHVGQIAMLRRIAGCPLRGENYFVADITAGCVGREQPAPRREFD